MDIVERLRKMDFIYYPDNAADISIEAADEIERLREALRDAEEQSWRDEKAIEGIRKINAANVATINHLENKLRKIMECDEMHKIARAALKEGE